MHKAYNFSIICTISPCRLIFCLFFCISHLTECEGVFLSSFCCCAGLHRCAWAFSSCSEWGPLARCGVWPPPGDLPEPASLKDPESRQHWVSLDRCSLCCRDEGSSLIPCSAAARSAVLCISLVLLATFGVYLWAPDH